MGWFKKKFRSVKKLPGWLFWLPARFLQLMLRCCYRVRIDDPDNVINSGRGLVAVTWHNRLCFFAAIFPKPTRKWTVAVVSASRDGQYIADFIACLGLRSLRGSSSRKGAAAQRMAVKAIRDGFNVAFTPDGPRGPKYRMKPGPLHLAQLTGAPLLPISINASSYWAIRSWDNFQIPKPGATLTLVLGELLEPPDDSSPAALEEYRRRAEAALMAITKD